jgi:hypothetical protein
MPPLRFVTLMKAEYGDPVPIALNAALVVSVSAGVGFNEGKTCVTTFHGAVHVIESVDQVVHLLSGDAS